MLHRSIAPEAWRIKQNLNNLKSLRPWTQFASGGAIFSWRFSRAGPIISSKQRKTL
jgi:hypothetical protein